MSYLWRRIGSYVIDISIISMINKIILINISSIFILTKTNIIIDFIKLYCFIGLLCLIAIGYNVLCYKYFKYPLGKLLMGVKVLDKDGRRVSTNVYFQREANKYIYFFATFGLYGLYQFLRFVTVKKQTYHERITKTHIFI